MPLLGSAAPCCRVRGPGKRPGLRLGLWNTALGALSCQDVRAISLAEVCLRHPWKCSWSLLALPFFFKPLIAFQAPEYTSCLTSSPCLLDAWLPQSASSCSGLDEPLWVPADLSPCDFPSLLPAPGQVSAFFAFRLSAYVPAKQRLRGS